MKYLVLSLMLVFSSCSKSVSLHNGPGNTDVSSPTTKSETISFANFGEGSTYVEAKATTFINLPTSGLIVTYGTLPLKSNLTVRVNGYDVCTYQWAMSGFVSTSNCTLRLNVHNGDRLTVSGIPVNQSVVFTVQVPK